MRTRLASALMTALLLIAQVAGAANAQPATTEPVQVTSTLR